MIITKKAISRRTVLRGVGATLALPFLDSMVPALTALSAAAPRVRRLGVVYAPNGIRMEHWTPATAGTDFEFGPILKPLEPFRASTLILTGLTSATGQQSTAVHARASTKFLTNMPPKFGQDADLSAGTSMDQLFAVEQGKHTQLSSLELALESAESGTCDVGLSCVYTNTISWKSPTTPLPMEANPRAVFERLFGDADSTDPGVRKARLRTHRSILDSVREKAKQLERAVGAADSNVLRGYFDAIRDVERRIQLAEAQGADVVATIDRPAGIPASFEEHARLMFDLQLLAYQSDLTRVVTFMLGKEYSGRTYPEIGVSGAHHPTSHHQDDPEKLDHISKINAYHVKQLVYFLAKMQSTRDGQGSLLDHSIIVYGAGMSDGNSHSPENLPVVVLGGGAGQIKGGRHIKYPSVTPLANLNMTLLGKLGVRIDQFADSTGELPELSM